MRKAKWGRLLAFAFLAFLVVYIINHKSLLTPLLNISLPIVLAITTIKFAQVFINGWFTKITLDTFGKSMSHKESAYLSLLSSLGNYFGPLLGGFGIRAAYLKQKYEFALTHFVGTLYGYYLITFFTTALIGLFSIFLLRAEKGVFSPAVTLAYAGLLAACAILFFIKIPKNLNPKKKILKRLYKRLLQVNEGWEILIENKRLFNKLILLGFLSFFVALATSYLEFKALKMSVNLWALIIYTTLGSLSTLVSFTPGAIGIRESIYIFSSSILLINNSKILQLAAIDRGIAILVLTLGYVYLQLWKSRMPATEV